MKNVTFSADEHWIEQARLVARSRHTTLNAAFREWLEQYATPVGSAKEVDALMKRLWHVNAGGVFSRDETNARFSTVAGGESVRVDCRHDATRQIRVR